MIGVGIKLPCCPKVLKQHFSEVVQGRKTGPGERGSFGGKGHSMELGRKYRKSHVRGVERSSIGVRRWLTHWGGEGAKEEENAEIRARLDVENLGGILK